ncbi:MAG: hypothetical protein HZA31_05220 [Opitutae bacterium]|nr:hypothetical protein [Opitutae bacterium]
MFCRFPPDHQHLTPDERTEYAQLLSRKNDLQQTLGTLTTDLEEVRRIAHRLFELDMLSIKRAKADVRTTHPDSASSSLAFAVPTTTE